MVLDNQGEAKMEIENLDNAVSNSDLTIEMLDDTTVSGKMAEDLNISGSSEVVIENLNDVDSYSIEKSLDEILDSPTNSTMIAEGLDNVDSSNIKELDGTIDSTDTSTVLSGDGEGIDGSLDNLDELAEAAQEEIPVKSDL